MKLSLSVASLVLLVACSRGDDPSISSAIAEQFDRTTDQVVDLSVVGPKEWDRVCILPPYTSREQAEKVLGFNWNSDSKSNIGASDTINVVVFVKENEVVAYTEHPRNKGDFSGITQKCVSRELAKYERVPGDSNWVFLRQRS